ncbi:uncharacterized protein CC84DRAFT_1199770, partial [Paraphaeosphaeria sporulosa]
LACRESLQSFNCCAASSARCRCCPATVAAAALSRHVIRSDLARISARLNVCCSLHPIAANRVREPAVT